MTSTTSDTAEPMCTDLHAFYCFQVLSAHFEGRAPPRPSFDDPDEPFALFVTWNIASRSRPAKHTLRGCIGNFSPMPLAKGLEEYALISALQDHRFSPIAASELPFLSCNVSLLTPFTPVSNPLDWTPGVHGIHITFPSPSSSSKRTLSATYLPEICPEQGWTKEETIMSAIKKAGYSGQVRVGDAVWNSLSVKVYGSVKASATYKDWLEWSRDE
ncbi:hypothetical protein P7C73_g4588, partial [Tremellales sp. Uapishka_1]